MAELIKEIDKLPVREQEVILRQLSESFTPIEIDSVIYMIPEEVDKLISSLSSQLTELRDSVGKN
tara:strand:+ start:4331 stop:4525 length:195 start_codon:yes stop_codon:yes gene_type:complete